MPPLRGSVLFHKHQFGSVKGRSALDPVFKGVVRTQQILARGGKAVWGMWDVRGGFQNATEKAVLERCQRSEQARRWSGYLKDFRAREFTIEWDGVLRGKERTNLGLHKAHLYHQ